MKRNSMKIFGGTLAMALTLSLSLPLAAIAQTTPVVNTAITKAQGKADQELTRRVTALTDLSTRIQAMKTISDAGKTSLTAQLQNQIDALNALKAKIDADTSTTTLKADVQSITDSYRIFALVIPQGRIYASVDRIATIVTYMSQVGAKLQTRITAAQTAGANVTAANTALTDYNAKLVDAQTQAQNALAKVSPLVPDQGDKTVMASNTAALQAARTMIVTALHDINAARKDITTIRKNLPKQTGTSATASTTTAQ